MPDDVPVSNNAPCGDEVYDTIVIGAGISGLSCASRLQNHLPGHRIKILEARDRIGGRIASVHKRGCRLDTGANWIHGVGTEDRRNPLMDILPTKRYRELKGGVMFKAPGNDSNGSEVGRKEDLLVPAEDAERIMGSMWGLIGELHEVAHRAPAAEAKEMRVVDAVQRSEVFQQAFAEVPEGYHGTLRGLPQFVENMEAAPLTAASAKASKEKNEQSAVGLLEYAIDDFEGEQVFLQDGYTPIFEHLAKPLQDADAIELGTEVSSISYGAQDAPVIVQTNKGDFRAKRVVVTIPLGVLKEHRISFSPALPKPKQHAIQSLGFGTLDKIFLIYSHPWWEKEPHKSFLQKGKRKIPAPDAESYTNGDTQEGGSIDSIMGFSHQLSGLSISPSEDSSQSIEDGPRLLSYLNLQSLTNYPVLSVFVSCANAAYIEALSDGEAMKLAHETLCSWLPEHLPPPAEPRDVHVTRWAQDKWARGSYSHMRAGVSEKRHREELGEPLRRASDEGSGGEAVVRFAGEHTSADHFATAHGALISGWREAKGIIGEEKEGGR